MENRDSHSGRDNSFPDGPAPFQGRTVIVATMHGKERVIAPRLETALGVRCQLPEKLNTDEFGTFTGETKRPGTALEAARQKVLKALELTGHTAGVASEGSFGPHPYYPFLATDLELLVFIDLENNLELVAELLSTQTNFLHRTIGSLTELSQVAETAFFPSHGLILKAEGHPPIKGIHDPQVLHSEAEALLALHSELVVETDMRAMHNPTRMQVIAECTDKLVHKLLSRCPSCGRPGFDVVKRLRGLPCQQCGLPTQMVRANRYQCVYCGYQEERSTTDTTTTADPMYCDFCNP